MPSLALRCVHNVSIDEQDIAGVEDHLRVGTTSSIGPGAPALIRLESLLAAGHGQSASPH